MRMPRTIRAQVDPTTIQKASRLFDASTVQIINEMLQNARRAGARKVVVTVRDGRMEMTDDGRGIRDPQNLLTLGTSDWEAETLKAEDPAGMGFFSLARRRAEISSRVSGQPGWRMVLEPTDYTGKTAVPVLEWESPNDHGTTVAFDIPDHKMLVARAVQDAARYGDLEVVVNGNRAERKDFLEDAREVTEVDGLRIGVMTGSRPRWAGREALTINFHGLLVGCDQLPMVHTVSEAGHPKGRLWWAAVDIIHCPRLELVLPGRERAVHNAFLDELENTARNAIYEAIRTLGEAPGVAYKDYARAWDAGIVLPEPPAALPRWVATSERTNRFGYPGDPRAYAVSSITEPLRVDAHVDDQKGQVLRRALELAGMLDRVLQQRKAYEGYDWYDRMDAITDITVIERTGADTSECLWDWPEYEVETRRVDDIQVRMTIRRGNGDTVVRELATDLAFNTTEPAGTEVLLTRTSDLTAGELTRIMMRALFAPSDDPESDSVETQWNERENEFQLLAERETVGPAEARRHHLERTANESIARALVPGEEIVIRRRTSGELQIELTRVATTSEETPA